MRAIVGLGNIGEKYKNTRHNVGFMVVDKISPQKGVILFKPDTMMNSSGLAVKKLVNVHSLLSNNLYIVHDDLDLKLGEYKIQFGKGPKAHNGVNSVEETLGTNDFWRVRVGIDNRNPDSRTSGEKYTLEDFLPQEREVIDGVLDEICKRLATL